MKVGTTSVDSGGTTAWMWASGSEVTAVVRGVRDALRPGGRFVAEFGRRGNVRAVEAAMRSGARQVGFESDRPLWYFPGVAEYATLLEAAGLEVRFAALFERPTPLEGECGLRDWVAMFGRQVLDAVPAGRQEEFLRAVENAARATLYHDGGWFADYRRLRVVAVRVE
jgi:hypothetical protein